MPNIQSWGVAASTGDSLEWTATGEIWV